MIICLADTPSSTDVFGFITTLSIFAVLAMNLKNLFWPQKPLEQQYVLRYEFEELKDEKVEDKKSVKEHNEALENKLEARMEQFRASFNDKLDSYVSKAEFMKIETKLEAMINNHDKLSGYTSKSIDKLADELSNKVTDIHIRIDTMHKDITKELAVDLNRILEKIDTTTRDKILMFDKFNSKLNNLEIQITRLDNKNKHKSDDMKSSED